MLKVRALCLLAGLALLPAACAQAEAPATEEPVVLTPPVVASSTATATLPPAVVETEPATAPAGTPGAPEAEASPTTDDLSEPWPADRFGYGVQSHAIVGDPAFAMDVIKNQLHMDWVKVQLEWALVQPDPETFNWFYYEGAVNEAADFGLRLMFSVVGAPAWTRAAGGENGPPDDYSQYADFLAAVLERFPGQVHAIEVWNEQNLDREWATPAGLSAEDYVAFLELAYAAVKAQDPDVIVISGALSPTGLDDRVTAMDDFVYLDEALAAGMLDSADCVGVHHNGYNIPPDVPFDEAAGLPEAETAVFRGPFGNPHHSWSFATTVTTYAEKVQAIDPAMQLCVTEFGWASSEGYDAYPENFEFALDNTLEEQAEYIVSGYAWMYATGDVWLAFLFNYDFGNKGSGPSDDTVPYSVIDLEGAPRPAFFAVGEMPKPE
ncbi:MAG: hypothetical protein ACRDHL_02730 [Candidatus Promineifilaceae bacterium]